MSFSAAHFGPAAIEANIPIITADAARIFAISILKLTPNPVNAATAAAAATIPPVR